MPTNRLLILDDEQTIARFIGSVADSLGSASVVTTTGSQFFEKLKSCSPTHIVLDLIMPDMDGVEVMERLAHQNCRASIIITSGVGGRVLDAATRTGREQGLNIAGTLAKPFTAKRLREVLLADMSPEEEIARARNGTDSTDEADERITVEAFSRALDNDELFLVYQPKVDCRSDRLAGFEALVRWDCPQLGVLSPDKFIPIAESSGLMGKMTRQVVEKATTWFSRVLESLEESNSHDSQKTQLIREMTLSINLSARLLDDSTFVNFVTNQCQQVSLDPMQVIFELTESCAMQDPVASLSILTRLRVQGFKLSIDDFGTGFSSMVQLVRLPFSEIKLDKSFVTSALRSEEDRAVISSIIDLGHSLGLVTTAEGVEDVKTFKYLNQVGCDLAQGYLFSRPLAGEQAFDWAHGHLTSWCYKQSAGKSVRSADRGDHIRYIIGR